jgi:hypothetical protein
MAEGQGSNPFAPASVFPPPTHVEPSPFRGNDLLASSGTPAFMHNLFATGGGAAGTSQDRGGSHNASSLRGQQATRGKAFANRSVVFNKEPNPPKWNVDTEVKQTSGSEKATELLATAGELPNALSSAFGNAPTPDFSSKKASRTQTPIITAFETSIDPTYQSAPMENTTTITDSSGGSKNADDNRKRRFEDLPKQNRFFEMKNKRDALRLKYIQQGILPDPDKAQDLSAAKSLLGTCMEMCSEYEREEREFQNEGDGLEMVRAFGIGRLLQGRILYM